MSGAGRSLPAVGLALASLACGGTTSTSSSTIPPPGPLPSPPYYVTVSASGVTPQVTHVWQGGAVIFRNDDARPHALYADPHPSHLECSGVLNLGTLQAGERREIRNLPVNACYFHAEENPADRAFWGVVVAH